MRKIGELAIKPAGNPPIIRDTGGPMIKLRAIRPLRGDWGTAHPGQTFEAPESVARDLESRGLVERVNPVKDSLKAMFVPENKSVAPDTVKAKPPKVKAATRTKRTSTRKKK
jgi:hypothetical protein